MEILILALALGVLAVSAQIYGVDSRPTQEAKEEYEVATKYLLQLSTCSEGNKVHSLLSETQTKTKSQAAIHDAANSFIDLVDKTYPNKNNHLRCANEVILDLSKI